jgi:uncharacterized membrane protein
MNFDSSKNLGGIGAILLFISPFTSFLTSITAGIVALVGLILLLLGARGLAAYYQEAGIFNNMLYGTLTAIVGVVATAIAAIWAFISVLPDFIYKIYPGWNGDWTTLPNVTPDTSGLTSSDFGPILGVFFALIVALFVVIIIVAIFYRKSLNLLSAKTNVGLFGTTATILLIGAALTIVFGFGLLLVWITTLLLAIAFFQIRSPTYEYTPSTATPSTEVPPPPV